MNRRQCRPSETGSSRPSSGQNDPEASGGPEAVEGPGDRRGFLAAAFAMACARVKGGRPT